MMRRMLIIEIRDDVTKLHIKVGTQLDLDLVSLYPMLV